MLSFGFVNFLPFIPTLNIFMLTGIEVRLRFRCSLRWSKLGLEVRKLAALVAVFFPLPCLVKIKPTKRASSFHTESKLRYEPRFRNRASNPAANICLLTSLDVNCKVTPAAFPLYSQRAGVCSHPFSATAQNTCGGRIFHRH